MSILNFHSIFKSNQIGVGMAKDLVGIIRNIT